MGWVSWRVPGRVWSDGVLRHAVNQWAYHDHNFMWDTPCGRMATMNTKMGGKRPRLYKGFVTCLECLAKEGER